MLNHGCFNAKKAKRPKAGDATAVPPRRPKTNAPKSKKPKYPTPADRALEGVEFKEAGVEWKVLSVRWSAGVESIVVWYYNVTVATAGEIEESKMLESIDNDSVDPYECLEFSSVQEIKNWVSESESA